MINNDINTLKDLYYQSAYGSKTKMDNSKKIVIEKQTIEIFNNLQKYKEFFENYSENKYLKNKQYDAEFIKLYKHKYFFLHNTRNSRMSIKNFIEIAITPYERFLLMNHPLTIQIDKEYDELFQYKNKLNIIKEHYD